MLLAIVFVSCIPVSGAADHVFGGASLSVERFWAVVTCVCTMLLKTNRCCIQIRDERLEKSLNFYEPPAVAARPSSSSAAAARDIEPNKFPLLVLFLPASGLGKQKLGLLRRREENSSSFSEAAAAYLIDISPLPAFSLSFLPLNCSINLIESFLSAKINWPQNHAEIFTSPEIILLFKKNHFAFGESESVCRFCLLPSCFP